MARLCETCFGVLEEQCPGETDVEVLIAVAIEVGADIADHDCEYRIGKTEERDGKINCSCGCSKRFDS